MRKIIFAALSLFVMSCSTPEIESNPGYQQTTTKCGICTAMGEDNRGDFIIIDHDYRYKVDDFMVYYSKGGKQICGLELLLKQPM